MRTLGTWMSGTVVLVLRFHRIFSGDFHEEGVPALVTPDPGGFLDATRSWAGEGVFAYPETVAPVAVNVHEHDRHLRSVGHAPLSGLRLG
jgi:hypothetical protein